MSKFHIGQKVWYVAFHKVFTGTIKGIVPPDGRSAGTLTLEGGTHIQPTMVFGHEPRQVVECDDMGEFTTWK